MSKGRILQRLVIAEAILQGARIASIARNLGVSRSWTSREANAPETRVLLSALIEQRAEMMATMIADAFVAIRTALKATKVIIVSNVPIEVPDHRTQLEAVGLFIKLLSTPVFISPKRAPAAASPRCITRAFEVDESPLPADHKARFHAVRLLIRILSKASVPNRFLDGARSA